MRRHDWSGFAVLAAVAAAIVEGVRGHGAWALGWVVIAAGLALVTRYWSLKHPAPMPYGLRWTLSVGRGNHSPEHLHRILEPRSGERLLEVGPGIGIHALPVASSLAPDGVLEVFDVQQEMLDDLTRRARERGIANIVATRGDARQLPYPDASFDGAYLVGVLGEIPDQLAALREVRRVLKRGGRLVVGEVLLDPDFVWFGALQRRAGEASFAFERKLGTWFSYLARFRPLQLTSTAVHGKTGG